MSELWNMVCFLIFRWNWGIMVMVLLWDPKPLYGSLIHEPPCAWSAPVSSPWHGDDITAEHVERWGDEKWSKWNSSLLKTNTLTVTFNYEKMRVASEDEKKTNIIDSKADLTEKMYLLLYYPTRWCASPVPQTNTALNTLRTSWHECVTSVTLFFSSRKVSLLEVFLPLFPTIWSQTYRHSCTQTSVWIRHRRTLCCLNFVCIKLLHFTHFYELGEQAGSAAISPGSKATFAFSRKQKKIPAALKEVIVVFVLIEMHCWQQRSNI